MPVDVAADSDIKYILQTKMLEEGKGLRESVSACVTTLGNDGVRERETETDRQTDRQRERERERERERDRERPTMTRCSPYNIITLFSE